MTAKTIRISDPLDLVKVVPYQLGFHPERSVVVVGQLGPRVTVVQRIDVPDAEGIGEAARVLAHNVARAECDSATVIGYEQQAGSSNAVVGATCRQLGAAGVEVNDWMVVRDGRVFFPMCSAGCCPPEGMPLPPDGEVAAVAEFVALGRWPAATREFLERRLAYQPGDLPDVLGQALVGLDSLDTAAQELAIRGWADLLRVDDRHWFTPALPCAHALALMIASLDDPGFRDVVVAWLCPGTFGRGVVDPRLLALLDRWFPRPDDSRADARGQANEPRRRRIGTDSIGWRLDGAAEVERSQRMVERLSWLVRQTPPTRAVALLSVLAVHLWFVGDGVSAGLAVDRALEHDPGNSLAGLVDRLLELGVRPDQVGSDPGRRAG
ncbi:MAG: hypothetical protein CSA84_07040 [Actinomycetales bacterium]|nr:MAG: hypothetical protein CSA84_07040 [Actinomycetales bacterium]